MYIERMTGANHNGQAWIAVITFSRSGCTAYFNGKALGGKAQGGEHWDKETGDYYWLSGVKKRGSNRHPHGSGDILVDRAALPALLALKGWSSLASGYILADLAPHTPAPTHHETFNEILME